MKKKIRFKHKQWKHLFFKYKVVEYEDHYREYERFRNWTIITLYLLTIIFAPLIMAFAGFFDFIDAFKFKEGKNGGYEEYTIHNK